ncbi:MAG: PD-(D/E)XK nuclease family protein, partial [Candidatus Nanopelagicales bacterium]
EIDDQGRVVVVDLKTMRAAPSRRDVASNLQLATYQRAVAESAVAGVDGEPGGAELVQLRLPTATQKPAALVQRQEAFPGRREVFDDALEHAVKTIDSEDFVAMPGSACTYCPFTTSCPAKGPGQEVVP